MTTTAAIVVAICCGVGLVFMAVLAWAERQTRDLD